MSNEFLRPRENRCKWFHEFEKEERSVYKVRGEKTQFSHKINKLNRFTKCLNWFKQQKNRPEKYEAWYDSDHIWVGSSVPRMKIDTIQTSYESIQNRSESFVRRFKIEKRRCIHESIQIYVNRFTWIRNFIETVQTVMSRFKLIERWFLTLFQTNKTTRPNHIDSRVL